MLQIKRHAKAPLFKDEKSKTVFTGFRGGFSWPREKDSFIVVIGEEEKTAKLRVVFEYRESSIRRLAKRLMALQRICPIDWIADIDGHNKNFADKLYEITYSEDIEDQAVYPSQTQLIQDDFYMAIQIIRKEFQENSLFLLKEGILFNIFKDLERRGSDNPAVADQYPEIMTFAGVIFDFPPRDQRLEQYFPRDAYSEFFDEDDFYSRGFMAL